MRLYSLISLITFFYWAAKVVKTDLATRKIPNIQIVQGGKIMLVFLIALIIGSWLGERVGANQWLYWSFYKYLGVHLFWSFLAGMILWYSEVWPAGDAKFYILCSLWLPLINPGIKYFPDYLFLSQLINIFFSASALSLIWFVYSGWRMKGAAFFTNTTMDLKAHLKDTSVLNDKSAVEFLVYMINLTLVFLVQQILNIESRGIIGKYLARPEIIYFFLFFLWGKLGGFFTAKIWRIIAPVAYALYFILGYLYFSDRLVAMISSAFFNMLKFGLLLIIGRFLLEFLMEAKDIRSLTAAELTPGMSLSSKALRMLRVNPVFDGAFDDCFKDGLTSEQVCALQVWLGRLPQENPKIEIVSGRPFAVWILAGSLLSLVLNRSLISYLRG